MTDTMINNCSLSVLGFWLVIQAVGLLQVAGAASVLRGGLLMTAELGSPCPSPRPLHLLPESPAVVAGILEQAGQGASGALASARACGRRRPPGHQGQEAHLLLPHGKAGPRVA